MIRNATWHRLEVAVEQRIEVPGGRVRVARFPLDQRIRSQRTMVSHLMRILPYDLAAFYERVSPEGAHAAISSPPPPAPPVVSLRVAIDSHIFSRRHAAESLRVEFAVPTFEGIRHLVKVEEEWLAFDGAHSELELKLFWVKEAAEVQALSCFPASSWRRDGPGSRGRIGPWCKHPLGRRQRGARRPRGRRPPEGTPN